MHVSDISVEYVDSMGSDLSIVNAARVSFAKESEWGMVDGWPVEGFLQQSDERLIQYLAKHKHYSPFNHTFLTVRVKAPIFVGRQLVKHEYMPWNEVSRRYVDSEPEFWFPEALHAKAENVKQGSGEVHKNSAAWLMAMEGQTTSALYLYEILIKEGVCAEEARIVLPHNLMTEWIWSGTLKAFHKMLSMRLDAHTQGATRTVAEKILPIVEQHFPVSIKALLESE